MQNPIFFARRRDTDPNVRLYGLNVFREERNHAEALLRGMLSEARSLPFLVFTPNLEMLMGAKHDPALRALLGSADLLLPDGIGTQLLSGFRISERIAGIEIGEFLLALAATEGYRLFFLGGKSGTAEAAAARLSARHRGLKIAGTHHGYFSADEEPTIVRRITEAQADLLIVCTGFPRQEAFLVRNRAALHGVRIALGLGGSLDVWSGSARRAPAWMRQCGLEWLYRIVREPQRIPRLFVSVSGLLRRPAR